MGNGYLTLSQETSEIGPALSKRQAAGPIVGYHEDLQHLGRSGSHGLAAAGSRAYLPEMVIPGIQIQGRIADP